MANHKVYYDATNNKEVVDVSGIKTDAEIEALGLTASKQVVTLTGNLLPEVVAGVLQTFDSVARASAEATTKEAERQTAEDNIKTKLGLTQAEYDDLVRSMK